MNPLPPMVIDQDEAAALHAKVLSENDVKERARVAAANRAAGKRKPKPGDHLFVEAVRGLPSKRRARAGIVFFEGQRRDLLVVGEEDTVGQDHVRVHQAEIILADPDLVVGAQSATESEASALRADLAKKEAEIAQLRAENARHVRDARLAAKDDGQGGPARLRAAAKARGETTDPDDGFSGGGK